MSDPTRQQLQQAYELIKGKQRQQALEILLPILQADENNVNAWWLLANAVTEPNDAREALENVLRLRPDHANARKMLDDLNRRYPPPPPQAEDGFDFGAPSGDIFAAAEASLPPAASSDPFGAPAQPFGGPAQPFGAPSGSSARPADPFGAPASSSFGALPVSTGGLSAPSSTARRPTASSSSNRTLLIILAVIGGVAVCACLACVVVTTVLPAAGIAILGASSDQIANVFQDITTTLEAGGYNFTLGDGSPLPPDAIARGSISYGESRQDQLAANQRHTWTFNGNAGDQVVIELLARDSNTDPYVALYGPQNTQIASNDDGGDGYNSLLTFSLPSAGTYTILARTFGDAGGPYELRLNRR